MKKFIIAFATICLLIITYSLSTYFLYILPKQQQSELALEKQKIEQEQKVQLDQYKKDQQAKELKKKSLLLKKLNKKKKEKINYWTNIKVNVFSIRKGLKINFKDY